MSPRLARKTSASVDATLHSQRSFGNGSSPKTGVLTVFAAANTVRKPVFGDEPFPKLRWECSVAASDALVFRARRGDIDLNGHVNNVHYVEWLLEGRPDEAGACQELDIVFKSETLAGEEVRVESVETEPGAFVHRVYAPGGRDHVLARSNSKAGEK